MARGGGRKGSGRKTTRDEMGYFKVLDAELPKVVKFLSGLIKDAMDNKTDKEKLRFGLEAAKILNSKAPQRIAGADGQDLTIKIVQFAGDK